MACCLGFREFRRVVVELGCSSGVPENTWCGVLSYDVGLASRSREWRLNSSRGGRSAAPIPWHNSAKNSVDDDGKKPVGQREERL